MIAGVILCGGKSARMGAPKAWLTLNGETLLTRTARILAEVTSPVIVSAAAGQELPALPPNVLIVRDLHPDRGPLGGLQAALQGIESAAIVFVAACDLPNLTAATVRTIIESLDEKSLAAVPLIDGRPQPLAAAYRAAILPVVEQHLAENQLSMRSLLDAIPVCFVDGLDSAAFVNVNTPADYANLT